MNELQQQIRDSLADPSLFEQVSRIRADQARRHMRTVSPTIMTAPTVPGRNEPDYLLKPLKGSVVLFWAPRGAELLTTLQEAYASQNEATLMQLSEEFTTQLHSRSLVSLEAAATSVIEAPSYFDLVYGDKTLASSLVLPEGIPYGAMGFPYNGGTLDDEQFRIVEHHQGLEEQHYDTLLIKTPPDLSEVEAAALDAVPSNQLGINIGDTSVCPGITVAVLVVVALVTCANGGCTALRDQLATVILTQEQFNELGAVSSAAELLAMRREILAENGF